jgi:hypothetical protein
MLAHFRTAASPVPLRIPRTTAFRCKQSNADAYFAGTARNGMAKPLAETRWPYATPPARGVIAGYISAGRQRPAFCHLRSTAGARDYGDYTTNNAVSSATLLGRVRSEPT